MIQKILKKDKRKMRRKKIPVLGVFSVPGDHPYGPVGIILIGTTAWMVGICFFFFRNVEKKEYISWLSRPLMLVSIITALYWFIWTYLKDDNEWSLIVSLMDAEKAGCDPDFTTYPKCDDGDGDPCFTINEKKT